MDTSTNPQSPASGVNGPAIKAERRNKRNLNYPIQLKINIDEAMNASLGRMSRWEDTPEGIIGRRIIKQYLWQHDAQFRQDIEGKGHG
jgi:hypothetical protein